MSTPSTEAADWHWLGLNGKEVAGDEWELVSGLSTGVLEPNTLVWKRGWAEWLPANRVPELAGAVPSLRREAVREPRRDPTSVKPPPLPKRRRDEKLPPPRPEQASKPKLPSQAAQPASGSETAARARDTLPPSSFGVIGTPRSAPVGPTPARPALQRAREPLPTLSDEPLHQSATATLRPPNAVPPPPRAMPGNPSESPVERIEVTATPMPSVIVTESRAGEVEHFPSSPPPEPKAPQRAARAVSADSARLLESTLDAGASPSKSARQLALIQASRTTSPDIVHSDTAQLRSVRGTMRSSMASLVERARNPAISVTGRVLLALLLLAGVCGALAVLVAVLFFSREDPVGRASHRQLPVPSSRAPRSSAGCVLAQPAARLAAAIERTVPVNVATFPGGKLAVGFGASKTKAAGLRIDPSLFDAAQVFEADGESELQGVVPSVKGGAPSFIVDRERAKLEFSRSVDAVPRFTLGQSASGFARALEGAEPTVIWPGGGKDKITEPRVAEAADSGYLVTFRRGGQFGNVFAGWLGKQGAAKTKLFKVESGARFAGTPAASIGERGALLAFAGRDTPTAAWRLLLAPVAPLDAPGKAREFRPLEPASGGAMSPSAAALGGGRWFLQWTEGASGSYRVRAQTLTAELEPIEQPILVSPKGANAGQGVAWVNGRHAISLFILTTAGRDELWGAALRCE